MLDVAVAYNRYKFLGDEFLTWLWFIIEKDPDVIKRLDKDFVSLEVGNRIVFENRRKESVERITIKGDGANLEEGILALQKGAMVTELKVVYKSGEQKYEFSLKGESLNISSLNVPNTALPETKEDLEGVVNEKIFHYDKVLQLLENLFSHFIKLRVSNTWQNKTVPLIRKWIQSSK